MVHPSPPSWSRMFLSFPKWNSVPIRQQLPFPFPMATLKHFFIVLLQKSLAQGWWLKGKEMILMWSLNFQRRVGGEEDWRHHCWWQLIFFWPFPEAWHSASALRAWFLLPLCFRVTWWALMIQCAQASPGGGTHTSGLSEAPGDSKVQSRSRMIHLEDSYLKSPPLSGAGVMIILNLQVENQVWESVHSDWDILTSQSIPWTSEISFLPPWMKMVRSPLWRGGPCFFSSPLEPPTSSACFQMAHTPLSLGLLLWVCSV